VVVEARPTVSVTPQAVVLVVIAAPLSVKTLVAVVPLKPP